MNRFLDALRRFLDAAGQALGAAWKVSIKWLSVPVNLCLAVLGLVFVVSFASWALGYAFEEAVLFFPDQKGFLHGELRNVPHSRGPEARAELIASELLLGPKNAYLVPAFESGVRVESAIYRRGHLFIDVSPDAALAPPKSLKIGIEAMNRSLQVALPGLRRLSLTIGGKEPYVVGLKGEAGKGIKKTGK
ncbi:MAG: GerMN domain-containing protein [Rectinemataceae bacterium]|jgi:hypothetical protein